MLQPSSVSGTFVLQFIKKCKGLRVGGSEYKRVFSSPCIMPWEGSERACVIFNWSEALIGQIRVARLSTFFAWAFTM